MVELYTFTSATRTFRYTPHEFEANFGVMYQPLAITRSDLDLSGESTKNALTLTLPPDSVLANALREAWTTGEIFAVNLQAAIKDDYGSWFPAQTLWSGRVAGIDDGTDAVSVRCEPLSVSLKRIGLRRLYSRRCSHVLYSASCGATQVSTTTPVLAVVGGNRIQIDAMVALAQEAVLPGGWVEKTTGERWMVTGVDINDATITLLTPGVFVPGETLTLVAGCDHTPATCAARFGNLANYGGFPFVPAKNPFSTGVF